jgi:hypothetical protein
MHIVVISIDRYLAINDPLNVRSRQENSQILLLISLIWFIAIFLSSPMIVLGMINPYNIIINGQCLINNQFFVIYGSVVSFVIPLIIVIIMYILTVRRLKKQIKHCQEQFAQEQLMTTANLMAKPFLRRQVMSRSILTTSSAASIDACSIVEPRRQRLHRQQTSFDLSEGSLDNLSLSKDAALDKHEHSSTLSSRISPHNEFTCSKSLPPFYQLKCTCEHERLHTVDEQRTTSLCQHCQSKSSLNVRPLSLQLASTLLIRPLQRQYWSRLQLMPSYVSTRAKSSAIRNERKAVKVLGVVFVIFVIAWFPFCIMNLLQVVCKRCAIHSNVLNSFVWLGYVSSSINPLVYTIFNRNFRIKFLALLQCQCFFRTQRQRQLSYYQSHSSLHGAHVQRTNGHEVKPCRVEFKRFSDLCGFFPRFHSLVCSINHTNQSQLTSVVTMRQTHTRSLSTTNIGPVYYMC